MLATTSRSTASRYFDALAGGEVPLEFLFSGSIFYSGAGGDAADRAHPVGARGRVPPARARLEGDARGHFRDTAWLRLGKASFDRLAEYKAGHALASWEAAVDALLEGAE